MVKRVVIDKANGKMLVVSRRKSTKERKQTDFQLVMNTYSFFYPVEMNTDSTQTTETVVPRSEPTSKEKREHIPKSSLGIQD